ncbi:hypothetical protein CU097_001571, partial [Rhizopus azygosporus]
AHIGMQSINLTGRASQSPSAAAPMNMSNVGATNKFGMTVLQQQALAQALNTGNPQVSLQRIQHLAQNGALPLAIAQQLQQRMGTPMQQNAATPTTAAPMQPSNAIQQLFAQLSPQHQQQMTQVFLRRNQLAMMASQGKLSQEDLHTQLPQARAAAAQAAVRGPQIATAVPGQNVSSPQQQQPTSNTPPQPQQTPPQAQPQQPLQQPIQQSTPPQQQASPVTLNPQQTQLLQQLMMQKNLQMRGRGRGQVPLTNMAAIQAM